MSVVGVEGEERQDLLPLAHEFDDDLSSLSFVHDRAAPCTGDFVDRLGQQGDEKRDRDRHGRTIRRAHPGRSRVPPTSRHSRGVIQITGARANKLPDARVRRR